MNSMSMSTPNGGYRNFLKTDNSTQYVGPQESDHCTTHVLPVDEVSLTHRLNQFRLFGIGCDVQFVVGDEKEVQSF